MFREELESFFTNPDKQIEKPPVIVDGSFLEENLKIHRTTLSRWREQGRIPFIQVGGVIRYDFNKVVAALEEGRVSV